MAADRATQLSDVDADRYITELLSSEVRRNNRDVIVLTNEDTNVPDNSQAVRLVILPPDKTINSRSAETNDAESEAKRILLTNANGANRVHRNTLLFLAAKRDEARTLRQAARNLLAWASLTQVRNGDDRTIPGLTGERALQANTGVRAADQAVRRALVSGYRWGLAPSQPNQQDSNKIQFTELRTEVGDHGEVVNAAFGRFVEEEALVDRISPSALARLVQQHIWNNPAYRDHIQVNRLWEMLSSYIFMPRLRNRSVLQRCIEQGILAGAFGYARDYNPDTGEYRGLRYEEALQDPTAGFIIDENSGGLLVAPSKAGQEKEKAKTEDARKDEPTLQGSAFDKYNPNSTEGGDNGKERDRATLPKRIRASRTASGGLSLNDYNDLQNDIVRILQENGAEVIVTITIEGRKEDGFDEAVTRPVRDNSGQLGFDFNSYDPT